MTIHTKGKGRSGIDVTRTLGGCDIVLSCNLHDYPDGIEDDEEGQKRSGTHGRESAAIRSVFDDSLDRLVHRGSHEDGPNLDEIDADEEGQTLVG